MGAIVVSCMFGFFLLLGFGTWAVCELYYKCIYARRDRIYKRNPDLQILIANYDKTAAANHSYHKTYIGPLYTKEHNLREKLSTATKQEYESFSLMIESLKEERERHDKINEAENNYKIIFSEIINKIKQLPERDRKFLLTRFWIEN